MPFFGFRKWFCNIYCVGAQSIIFSIVSHSAIFIAGAIFGGVSTTYKRVSKVGSAITVALDCKKDFVRVSIGTLKYMMSLFIVRQWET